MDSPSARYRIGWRTLILAFLVFGGLTGLATYQYFEVRRLNTEALGRTLAAEATQASFDAEMAKAWGHYLEALGGSKHPNGDGYEFEGGIRVRAGRNWCAFDFVDTHDSNARKQLMNTLAPEIVLGSNLIMPRIDAEWQSLLQSSNGEPKEHRFVDDGGSGFPMSVYLRYRPDAHTIIIRWAGSAPD